ncbi:mucin-like glycoprotein [Trypanosoma cruzi cruzi]|nr:mucin-like glycoprotein [Trypanosoma cruzi cruzi]
MMTTAMTATALRREVCALLSLALLCCCASVCVAAATGTIIKTENLYSGATAVNVSVEISCADSNKPLQWRFPGQTDWTKCVLAQGAHEYNADTKDTGSYNVDQEDTAIYTVDTSDSDDDVVVVFDTLIEDSSRVSELLCLSAEQMYVAEKCNESCKSDAVETIAFTMEYLTNKESGVYKKWLEYNKSSNPAASTSGVCQLNTPVEEASGSINSGPQEAAAVTLAAQVTAVEAPAAGQAAGGSSSAASGASSSAQTIEQGITSAYPQAGSTSQLPTGEGVGRTDASGTAQTPSATPASGNGGASGAATAGAASQSGNPTHTREANNSAATGARDPGTSDSSAIATAWVHTPLLLLLTALACAAGQRCGAATHE